jgi:hypothetical protein
LLQLSVEHMFENALEPEEVLCFWALYRIVTSDC